MTALAVEFGWSEEFILLWLPLSRAEQYYHALLRRADWLTTLPLPRASEQAAQLAAKPLTMEVPPEVAAALARFDAPPPA